MCRKLLMLAFFCSSVLLPSIGHGQSEGLIRGKNRFTASFLVAPYVIQDSNEEGAILDAGANAGIGGGLSWNWLQSREDTTSVLSIGVGSIFEKRDNGKLDFTPTIMAGFLDNRVGIGYGYFTGRGDKRHRLYLQIPIDIKSW